MKKIYEIVEKLNFGGQDREFFDIHEEEIREHNVKLSKALIIVLIAIDGIYAVTGMNCQSNPQIRIAYILFLVFLMVLLALFEVIEKKTQNGYVIIFTIIEMAFVFLLFAEPVLDRTPIACFIPAFFAIAFVLPLIPIHWMAEIFALDLVVFFAVTLVCKEYSVAYAPNKVFQGNNSPPTANCPAIGIVDNDDFVRILRAIQRPHSDVHDACRRTRLQDRPQDDIDNGRNTGKEQRHQRHDPPQAGHVEIELVRQPGAHARDHLLVATSVQIAHTEYYTISAPPRR